MDRINRDRAFDARCLSYATIEGESPVVFHIIYFIISGGKNFVKTTDDDSEEGLRRNA